MNSKEGRALLDNAGLLARYKDELHIELGEILNYWALNTLDPIHGGFIGRIDECNIPHPGAPKGSVLNARILWTFSAAYKLTGKQEQFQLARIAFKYFCANFIDQHFGGVYWTPDADGRPLNTKKQVYAQAFAIYGCCAYYDISNDRKALDIATGLFGQIEANSFDPENTGYLEAFTRDWQPLADPRLSEKDANEQKSMNTHLHVLEAYSSLYRAWPDETLKQKIILLLGNFSNQFIGAANGHLNLFFDKRWNLRSALQSYGHDIEAAWIIPEAAETIHDAAAIESAQAASIKLARAAGEGLDADGGLWYEYDSAANHLVKEKHWWVQAEAMIGFFNHWQLTGDRSYLERSIGSWEYVKAWIKDQSHGEWLWGREDKGGVMKAQDKAGVWKCPYHNSRACIEIINRLDRAGVSSDLFN
jgi:mannobiose 2-epimerase